PYALFAYIGLIPWTFFSVSVNQGGQSLLTNASLITKVPCPREVFPITSIVLSAFDALVSTVMLGVLFVVFGFVPESTFWLAIPLLVVQVVFTLGTTFVIAALTVYVRDVRQAMPLLLQLGLFATPVAYPVPLSPFFEKVYALVNPLAPVIEGYRSVILYGNAPRWDLVGLASITAFVFLVGGYYMFKRLEAGFADVA
ncbi:MAG: lipopolysaccharide transport system permease protein, partial [Actinomycetota bacterium]|nr:lipopolysaccharide transport system permease protein [Actinomycetota bacterium]